MIRLPLDVAPWWAWMLSTFWAVLVMPHYITWRGTVVAAALFACSRPVAA